ncbi:MAG: hypothetical protein JJE04_02560 [Acidobacteriia bacterium]|nr:hypothetical protein [Terriglobia bacterium]
MRSSLIAVSAALIAVMLLIHRSTLEAQDPAPDWSATTVLVRAGLTAQAPARWTGLIEPVSTDARLLSLTGFHFLTQPAATADRIEANRFDFATRAWMPAQQHVDLSPTRPGPRAVFPNGVYARLGGGASARFSLKLNDTAHEFSLSQLPLRLDNGNVEVEQVPTPAVLSAPGERDADYPSVAAGAGLRSAAAWQEFLGERDRIMVREFDGSQWQPSVPIETEETRDVFRTALAYDGQGALHLIWAAQVEGNWDLYERRKTSAGWQEIERLTTASGSDLHQRVAAGPDGNLYLVWQSFRNLQSGIRMRVFSQGAWGGEVVVDDSTANHWEPDVAVSPKGTVWIAWDGYAGGNYDIYARSYSGGALGPVRQVTQSPRFEARAAIAADSQERVWIAFEEAEANWGKDYGYLIKDRGNPLHQTRTLRIVRLNGPQMEEPAQPLSAAFPLGLPEFLHNPRLVALPNGSIVVQALQLTHADRVLEVWAVRGVWENVLFTLDGAGWHRHQVLPSSRGANDLRAAVAASSSGAVYAAWATDEREFGAATPKRQSVQVACIAVPATPGEIAVKPFQQRPSLEFATHANETTNLKTMRAYTVRSGNRRYHIYRGDLHRHTSLSGDGVGDGSLWDFYRYMLDAASMDHATVTDHQGGATQYNWWKSQKSTDLFLIPNRLTTIYAYERSVLYPNGHRNMVFGKRGVPILPVDPAENQQGRKRSSDAVLPYLRQYNGISFRHTIATNQGADWQDHNNELEPLVEIYQGHRVVYEHEGGPKGATAEKPYLHRSGYQPSGYLWNALAKGYRFGIQASSDHCSTHISYSCLLAEDSSREVLIDAMRKRRSYGAMDNIVLDFKVKAGSREYVQGEEMKLSGQYSLMVNAIGTGSIKRIDVIRNESYIYSFPGDGKNAARFTYTDPSPASGENRYYVRLEQEDGMLAWSSPVWVQR